MTKYQHLRTAKLEDFALTLGKLPVVDYIPPLGGQVAAFRLRAWSRAIA